MWVALLQVEAKLFLSFCLETELKVSQLKELTLGMAKIEIFFSLTHLNPEPRLLLVWYNIVVKRQLWIRKALVSISSLP